MTYEKYIGNGGARPDRPSEVQSDLENIRAELSNTLNQIEERVSLHELTDQFVERLRNAGRGPGDFMKNLGASFRDHPIPVVLIGAGITSLIISERREGGRGSEEEGGKTEELKERFQGMRARRSGRAKERAGQVKERAGQAKERAGEAKERVSGKVSDLRERTGYRARRVRERGGQILNEQPLVLAGIGIAVGAMLAAGAPTSERERRAFGSAGEGVQRAARRGAEEGDGHGGLSHHEPTQHK